MTVHSRRAPRLTGHSAGADIVPMAVHLLPGPFTVDTYHRLDIAVLRRPGGLAGAWLPGPRDVLLVIEVADTSLVQSATEDSPAVRRQICARCAPNGRLHVSP